MESLNVCSEILTMLEQPRLAKKDAMEVLGLIQVYIDRHADTLSSSRVSRLEAAIERAVKARLAGQDVPEQVKADIRSGFVDG